MNRNAIASSSANSVLAWMKPIEEAVKRELLATGNDDASHDMSHLERVSRWSIRFANEANGDELVAYAAAMLHDIVNLPKNHPDRKNCSRFAAERAALLLSEMHFPEELISAVCHAIHAHSFSANVEPETIEAKCLQDADRMEALGALGVMRLFYVSGKMESKILEENDPEGILRKLNDKEYALDHFPLKLFTLHRTMKTDAGRRKAQSLHAFLQDFRREMIQDHWNGNKESGPFYIAQVCQNAGSHPIALFDQEDPFATNRHLLYPEKYALDSFLDSNNSYVQKFLVQLKLEFS